MDPRELNLAILIIGVVVVGLVLALPTIYYDYKDRRDKKQ
jgi:hypothetical protein